VNILIRHRIPPPHRPLRASTLNPAFMTSEISRLGCI
jgi:hypothetical protein